MTRQLIPARVGEAWILLDALLVKEVLGAEPWFPVPGARAEMPGILAWRGRAVPLVDLAAPFGSQRLQSGEKRARTLIATVAESMVAVPVDAAREVHAFSGAELRPCSVTNLPYGVAEAELFGRVMPHVDLARFVDEIVGGTARELQARGGMSGHASTG